MVQEAIPVEISTMPDLAHLADEVARTRTPRILKRDGEAVAVLSPAPMKRRRKGKTVTQEDIEATLSVFGAWKDKIDPDAFKRQVREGREDDRSPVRR